MNKSFHLEVMDQVVFVIMIFCTSSYLNFIDLRIVESVLSFIYLYFILRIAYVLLLEKKRMYSSRLIFLIVGLCMFSSVWSDSRHATLYTSFFELFPATLIMMYMATYHRFERIMGLTFFTGILMTIPSYFFIAFLPKLGIGIAHVGAWKGIFTNKNSLALSMDMFIVFTLYQYQHVKRTVQRFGCFLVLLAQCLLVWNSKSSTGKVVLLALLALIIFLKLYELVKNKYIRVQVLNLFFLCLSLIFIFISYNMGSAFQMIGREATFSDRLEIWIGGLVLLKRRWILGYGFNSLTKLSFAKQYMDRFVNWNLVGAFHNGYIDTYFSIGLVGFFLVIVSFLVFYYRAIRLSLGRRNNNFYISLMFLVFLTIYNFFECTLLDSNSSVWDFFVFFYVYLLMNIKGETEHDSLKA